MTSWTSNANTPIVVTDGRVRLTFIEATKPALMASLAAFWLLLIVGCLSQWSDLQSTDLFAQPAVAAALTIVALWTNSVVCKQPFPSLASMTLVSYACFHLLEVVPVAAGLCDQQFTSTARWSHSNALAAYLLFLAGSQIGTILGCRFSRIERARNDTGINSGDVLLWNSGQVFLVAGGLFLGVGLYQIGFWTYISLDYSSTFLIRRLVDPRFLTTGVWAVPCALLALLSSSQTKEQRRFVYLVSGLFFLLANLVGYRGAGFVFAMAAFIVARRRMFVKRLWLTYSLALVLVVVLIPSVKRARSLPLNERLSVVNLQLLDSLWDGPREIGGPTFQSLTYSIELVPGRSDYWMGASYIQALKHVIPNLGSWTAESADFARTMRVAEWLTYVVDASTWRAGGGLGASGISEPYINFGPSAVPVHFCILFFILTWYDLRSSIEPWALAKGSLIVMPVCWSARDDVHSIVRGAVWGIAVLWCLRVLMAKRSYLRQ